MYDVNGGTDILSSPRVWISSDDVSAVAQKGFRLVHAASDYFYLDCGAGEWVGVDIGHAPIIIIGTRTTIT